MKYRTRIITCILCGKQTEGGASRKYCSIECKTEARNIQRRKERKQNANK